MADLDRMRLRDRIAGVLIDEGQAETVGEAQHAADIMLLFKAQHESDDDRVARLMSMVTPLGYDASLALLRADSHWRQMFRDTGL